MKNRFQSVSTLVALFLLLLAGCSQGQGENQNNSESDNTPIVIWAYDSYIDAAKEAVLLYTKEHPEQKFDVVELGQDDLVQKLNIALASGDYGALPDVICEEDYNLKSYVTYYKDSFVDLTDFVDTDLYVEFKVRDCTVDGRIWGIPYDTGVSAWYYRIDVLNDAGFTEEDVESITWDEFLDIGRVVYDKTGKYLIPLVPEGNIEGRVILQSSNSWYYNDDGTLNIIGNQAIRDMSETIKKIFNSGVVDKVTSWDDIISSFYNGVSAGVIGGAFWTPIVAQNEEQSGLWRVTQVPRMEGNASYTNYGCCGGCSWLVCNTAHQKEAIAFLMETVAVSTELANTMMAKGYIIPALKSAVHTENAVNGDAFFGYQNICEKMAEWSYLVPYCNYSTNSYEIAYAHGNFMTDYIKGITSLDDVILQLDAEARTIEGR